MVLRTVIVFALQMMLVAGYLMSTTLLLNPVINFVKLNLEVSYDLNLLILEIG